MIRESAKDAVERLKSGEFQPLKVDTPVEIEIDFYYSPEADVSALIPTVERTGDRTIRFTSPDALQAYRTFLASYYLARSVS